jgi:hypothetical protein
MACKKLGISRNSAYRWRKEDEEFSREMNEALVEGVEEIDDFCENKLFSLIQNDSERALLYYLNRRHPKYRDSKYNQLEKFSLDEEMRIRRDEFDKTMDNSFIKVKGKALNGHLKELGLEGSKDYEKNILEEENDDDST